MFRVKVWFWSLSIFSLLTFCVFVVWNLAVPNPTYIRLLETLLPGFKWISAARFFVGAVESFFYGAYIALVFVPIHNFFYSVHHPETALKKDKTAA